MTSFRAARSSSPSSSPTPTISRSASLPVRNAPATVTILTPASLIPDPADGINTFAQAVSAIEAGETYFNIHTVAFPGGEIAGQITVVPEPASLTLLTLGLGGILAFARFGRRLVA